MPRLCFPGRLAVPSLPRTGAQDDIHIERVKLDTAAASAGLFGSDERRSRTDEWRKQA